MKPTTRKPCPSMHHDPHAPVKRAVVTAPLQPRHCHAARTAGSSGTKAGVAKACGLIVAALTLALAGVPDATAAARRAGASGASAPPPTTLAPAAPITSPVPPVNAGEDIRDIRSPRSLPNPWAWAAYAAGALTLLTGAFGAWLWFRRDQSMPTLPHELALARLEAARRFLTSGQVREFCIEASEVIRDYIEVRFNARAAHRTTEEFLHDLLGEQQDLLINRRDSLAQFLQHCDMAKFALWRFSESEMEALLSSARTFVLQGAAEPAPATTVKAAAVLPKSPRIHLDPPARVRAHATPKPA